MRSYQVLGAIAWNIHIIVLYTLVYLMVKRYNYLDGLILFDQLAESTQ